jgi:hypothetical protein
MIEVETLLIGLVYKLAHKRRMRHHSPNKYSGLSVRFCVLKANIIYKRARLWLA